MQTACAVGKGDFRKSVFFLGLQSQSFVLRNRFKSVRKSQPCFNAIFLKVFQSFNWKEIWTFHLYSPALLALFYDKIDDFYSILEVLWPFWLKSSKYYLSGTINIYIGRTYFRFPFFFFLGKMQGNIRHGYSVTLRKIFKSWEIYFGANMCFLKYHKYKDNELWGIKTLLKYHCFIFAYNSKEFAFPWDWLLIYVCNESWLCCSWDILRLMHM